MSLNSLISEVNSAIELADGKHGMMLCKVQTVLCMLKSMHESTVYQPPECTAAIYWQRMKLILEACGP